MVDFNRVKDYAELENNFILLQGEEVNINPLLNQFEIESGIYHEDVISYNDGIISALKEGYGSLKNSINNSYYDAYFMVLDKIESSKYNVDNDEKYIYVSDDIDDEIKSNLTIDNKYILYKECEYRDNNPTDEEANECVNYMKKRHIGYKFNINIFIEPYRY